MIKAEMDIIINKILNKIKPTAERVKSFLLVILFCAVIALSAFYIVMTYQETLKSESMIDVNSMIFMSDRPSAPNAVTDSLLKVTPSVICYKYESVTKGIVGNKNIIDSIYSVFSENIIEYLSGNAECIVYSDHEGNALLTKSLNAPKYVYFKYHTPLVSSILRSYSDVTASFDLTEFPGGEVLTVSEILLTYYLDQWRFIVIDGNGTVAECKLENSPENFDISWLSAYNDNKAFIDFKFGVNASNGNPNYSFDTTAVISENIVFAKYFSLPLPNNLVMMEKENQDKIADLFYINKDRSGQFDSNDSYEYIDSHGTLSFSKDGRLSYLATENGGIELSNYLGYENFGENYTVDDVLRASSRLLHSLNTVDKTCFGGSAYLSLQSVSVEHGTIVVEFGYHLDNIAIADKAGNKYCAARLVCDGKRFVSVSAWAVSFIENPEKSPMLPQNWILEQMLASSDGTENLQNISVAPMYVLPNVNEITYENSYIHAEWIFSTAVKH